MYKKKLAKETSNKRQLIHPLIPILSSLTIHITKPIKRKRNNRIKYVLFPILYGTEDNAF